MFDEKDLQQIREHGLTPEQAETQLENFRRGFPFLNVVRAASPGDGVLVVGTAEADAAVERYEKESAGLGVVKFVPASGAATRMSRSCSSSSTTANAARASTRCWKISGSSPSGPNFAPCCPPGPTTVRS